MLLACDDLGTLLSAIFVGLQSFPHYYRSSAKNLCGTSWDSCLAWDSLLLPFHPVSGAVYFPTDFAALAACPPPAPLGWCRFGVIKDRETQPNKIPSKLTFLPHPTHYTLLLSPPCPLQMMKKEITSVLLILDFNEKDVLKARSSIWHFVIPRRATITAVTARLR